MHSRLKITLSNYKNSPPTISNDDIYGNHIIVSVIAASPTSAGTRPRRLRRYGNHVLMSFPVRQI